MSDNAALNELIGSKIALALAHQPKATIVIISWRIPPGCDWADFAIAAWPEQYRNVMHGLLDPSYDHVVIETDLWRRSHA